MNSFRLSACSSLGSIFFTPTVNGLRFLIKMVGRKNNLFSDHAQEITPKTNRNTGNEEKKKKESKKPLEIIQPVVFLLQILPRTRFELILFNLI